MVPRWPLIWLTVLQIVVLNATPVNGNEPTFSERLIENLIGFFTTAPSTTVAPAIMQMYENRQRFSEHPETTSKWREFFSTLLGSDTRRRWVPKTTPLPTFKNTLNKLFSNDESVGYQNSLSNEDGLIRLLSDSISSLKDDEEDSNAPAKTVDTGGSKFDKLILMENEPGLFGSMMGKFNRRGLDWSDGNLKLVNVYGNNLLGSEFAVHDRSVDIPVQSWLDVANSLINTYTDPGSHRK